MSLRFARIFRREDEKGFGFGLWSHSGTKGGTFAMKTVNGILENQDLRGALRVLTGKTNSGKRAIYISDGNPAGFRLLAQILQAQADGSKAADTISASLNWKATRGKLSSRPTIRWRSFEYIAKTIFLRTDETSRKFYGHSPGESWRGSGCSHNCRG